MKMGNGVVVHRFIQKRKWKELGKWRKQKQESSHGVNVTI